MNESRKGTSKLGQRIGSNTISMIVHRLSDVVLRLAVVVVVEGFGSYDSGHELDHRHHNVRGVGQIVEGIVMIKIGNSRD